MLASRSSTSVIFAALAFRFWAANMKNHIRPHPECPSMMRIGPPTRGPENAAQENHGEADNNQDFHPSLSLLETVGNSIQEECFPAFSLVAPTRFPLEIAYAKHVMI